jgi:hypothetical protein
MLQVNISFPSGSGENLQLPERSNVGDLKILAQKSLRQGFLKLITAEGHVLTNPEISLQAAGVQEGEHLTVVAQQTKVAHTGQAFALWCSGGDQGGCLGQSRMSRKFRPQTKHLPQSQLMGQ